VALAAFNVKRIGHAYRLANEVGDWFTCVP